MENSILDQEGLVLYDQKIKNYINEKNKIATKDNAGTVRPDGETITIDENGVISAVGGTAEKVNYENESVADVTNVKEALDGIFEGNISSLTTNLLNATLSTTESNGVTCTNNGDGTYTLNGTSTQEGQFNLIVNTPITFKAGVTYRIVGCPVGGGWLSTYWVYAQDNNYVDIGDGVNFTYDTDKSATVGIGFGNGITFDNLTFKPMLTTNLEATLDYFVPYTGNTGKLNGDVAEIRKTYFSPHNKPSGSYTGNGEARTINTGGIGSGVIIASPQDSVMLVTPLGGFGIDWTTGNLDRTGGATTFLNGIINLEKNGDLNLSGIVYDYYVI